MKHREVWVPVVWRRVKMEKPNLKLRKFCRVTLFKEQSRIQKV